MNSPGKLVVFALGALGIFLLAFGMGRIAGNDPDADRPSDHASHGAGPDDHGADGMTSHGAGPDDHGVDGMTSTGSTYRLEVEGAAARAPGEQTLRFRVLDGGEAVTDFDVEHEKELHLILVDKADPRIYRHLHPAMATDGTWSVRTDLGSGDFRMYADTKPAGAAKQVLTHDLVVSGRGPAPQPLPAPYTKTTADGYDVGLAVSGPMFRFTVEKNGKGVEPEPYLGAGGHLVIIREKTLDYLHAHPMTAEGNRVGFHAEFEKTGRYVLHFDFKVEGKVHTATFVYDVDSGSDQDLVQPTPHEEMNMEMEGHDHH